MVTRESADRRKVTVQPRKRVDGLHRNTTVVIWRELLACLDSGTAGSRCGRLRGKNRWGKNRWGDRNGISNRGRGDRSRGLGIRVVEGG